MIALYGTEVEQLLKKSPKLYRMLWLFRFRSADRKAWQVSRGIAASLSKLESSYYRHVTETEDQAGFAEDIAKGSN